MSSNKRRHFLKVSITFGTYAATVMAGLLKPSVGFSAWSAKQFAETSYSDALLNLYQGQKLIESDKIKLKLPRIAENGAVVPITVSSSLEDIQRIDIIVEKNPVPLAARFELFQGTDAFVSGRLKMAETCDVIVVAHTKDKLFSHRKKVKVTIGGCGG